VKIEFASNQEDDGLDRGESNEAAGASFGLKQSIDGFEKSVGQTGLRTGDDVLHAAAYERGHTFHELGLAVHHEGAPVVEHAAYAVNLLAIKDLAQLILVEAGASCRTMAIRAIMVSRSSSVISLDHVNPKRTDIKFAVPTQFTFELTSN